MAKIVGLLLLTLVAGCTSLTYSDSQVRIHSFFKREGSQVSISPDGKTLMVVRDGNLFLKPFSATDWTQKTFGGGGLNSPVWKGNSRILFHRQKNGDENFHIYSYNIDSKEVRELSYNGESNAYIIDTLVAASPTDILFMSNRRDPKTYDLYRMNVVSGESNMIFQNSGIYKSFLADNKGDIRLAVGLEGKKNILLYRATPTEPFRRVLTVPFTDTIDPLFFDSANKSIFAISNINRDTTAVVQIDPSSGKILDTLFADKQYDTTHVAFSPQRRELMFAVYADWKNRFHFFTPHMARVYNELQGQFPGVDLSIGSVSENLDKFVIVAQTDRSGPKYLSYDFVTKTYKILFFSTNEFKPSDLVEMKPIQYAARDGLMIHGYLYLPKGKTPKSLPLVVLPHGGPWARDVWGFDFEAQFLANRGYAVLKMNFRGSTGYGKKFWMAGFKQWGRAMQNDITDGVFWLVKEGVVDPARVGIYGASYGGYAALAGLAFTPDVYACGVDYVGVSNLFTFLETMPPSWNRERLYEMVGHPIQDKELLASVSPSLHADKIKKPLFVAHGSNDPRVKQIHSDMIVAEMKKRSIDVKYTLIADEGHGFAKGSNAVEFYEDMAIFFDKYLMKK